MDSLSSSWSALWDVMVGCRAQTHFPPAGPCNGTMVDIECGRSGGHKSMDSLYFSQPNDLSLVFILF